VDTAPAVMAFGGSSGKEKASSSSTGDGRQGSVKIKQVQRQVDDVKQVMCAAIAHPESPCYALNGLRRASSFALVEIAGMTALISMKANDAQLQQPQQTSL